MDRAVTDQGKATALLREYILISVSRKGELVQTHQQLMEVIQQKVIQSHTGIQLRRGGIRSQDNRP